MANIQDVFSGDTTYDLWLLMRRATYAAEKARVKELHRYGISIANAAVLFIVHQLGRRATPTELSKQMLKELHSVSGLLKRMERDGLIKIVKDTKKKSKKRIELTEKGRKAYSHAKKRESIYRILSVLSEEKQRQFKSYLMEIRETALKELE